MTPSRTIGIACTSLHPIGTALTDAATTLHDIRDQLPPRGPLTDLHHELVEVLARAERAYHAANDALIHAYRELEHAERSTREGWTPQPLTGSHT